MSKLWDFLVSLVSYINPFSENFFGYKLIELIRDLFKLLFIPSEERITALTNTVTSKFNFIDTIKLSVSSLINVVNNVGNAPVLNIKYGATKYNASGVFSLDFSFYAPFKGYGDIVITGFVYAMFIWRIFVKLPGIVSGNAGNIEISEGHLNIVSKRGGNR